MIYFRVEFAIGNKIEDAVKQAIEKAKELNVGIVFDFNEVDIHVTRKDNEVDVIKDHLLLRKMLEK